jgi:thiamine biosynthesis protein ThiC
MSNKRNLYEIAESVADITLELMEDSIDWQLGDYPADGDDYNAIHSQVMQSAIEIMYKQNTITQ